MDIKKLIPELRLHTYVKEEALCMEAAIREIQEIEADGADGVLLIDDRENTPGREETLIQLVNAASAVADLPLLVCQVYARFEDIKKILYAGAQTAVMDPRLGGGLETLKEGCARFGAAGVIGTLADVGRGPERISDKEAKRISDKEAAQVLIKEPEHVLDKEPEQVLVKDSQQFPAKERAPVSAGELEHMISVTGCGSWILSVDQAQEYADTIAGLGLRILIAESLPSLAEPLRDVPAVLEQRLGLTACTGAVLQAYEHQDLVCVKTALKDEGIAVRLFESTLSFDSFRTDGNGLIPTIVQDYKSGKVLMLAYMNRESFEETLRSGRMTYYSRSRACLWKKGDTSGHFQFVKSLDVDCDRDTLLAKVRQIGAACHTGHESCFYTNLLQAEQPAEDPSQILQEVYATVADRKVHPREGSYTNYLFEKGIDKILKKVGEEATEIVIAAKNPDPEELKYEISDFLYHLIVLMAERGLTWDEIFAELAKRH